MCFPRLLLGIISSWLCSCFLRYSDVVVVLTLRVEDSRDNYLLLELLSGKDSCCEVSGLQCTYRTLVWL